MKVTGKVADISFDYETKKPKLTLILNERESFLEEIDELRQLDKLSIELKKHRDRRSKNANDYLWALCTEIARDQNLTPDEVYRIEVRNAGVCAEMCVKSELFERTSFEWARKGIGWFTVKTDESGGWTYFLAYYGSSSYDTAEMSRLIEKVVEDAKALGIQTASERELSLLKENWKNV